MFGQLNRICLAMNIIPNVTKKSTANKQKWWWWWWLCSMSNGWQFWRFLFFIHHKSNNKQTNKQKLNFLSFFVSLSPHKFVYRLKILICLYITKNIIFFVNVKPIKQTKSGQKWNPNQSTCNWRKETTGFKIEYLNLN